ncbi:MAG: alpha/beta fold hydrolase [Acidimicrobiia bacterium]
MTLRKPPGTPPSRTAGRLLLLLALLALVGVAVWAAVTGQRIDHLERTRYRDLELADPVEVGELTVNLSQDRDGAPQVVLLHDFDVAGGILWDGVVAQLPESYGVARVDLPGFGLSSRMPEPGQEHTVAEMAVVISEVLVTRFPGPVILAGVGLGGEVAAEVALARPELVSGLVLIDVDFWDSDDWVEVLQGLPWLGRAFSYTFETGGALSADRWAEHCEEGGWCPTVEETEMRDLRETVEETTDSVYSYARTAPASQVPSRLDQVTAPTVFVHSTKGPVPPESVDRIVDEELPGMTVVEVEAWQAHLEAPAQVASAIDAAAG